MTFRGRAWDWFSRVAQTDRSVDTLAALPYAGQALAEPQALNTMLDTTTAANIKSTFFIVRLFGVPVEVTFKDVNTPKLALGTVVSGKCFNNQFVELRIHP